MLADREGIHLSRSAVRRTLLAVACRAPAAAELPDNTLRREGYPQEGMLAEDAPTVRTSLRRTAGVLSLSSVKIGLLWLKTSIQRVYVAVCIVQFRSVRPCSFLEIDTPCYSVLEIPVITPAASNRMAQSFLLRGSIASRSPSPTKLRDITVRKIAIPGGSHSQGRS